MDHVLGGHRCNTRQKFRRSLFGKPESFTKRRMGVALAFDADVEVARTHAKLAASKVKARVA